MQVNQLLMQFFLENIKKCDICGKNYSKNFLTESNNNKNIGQYIPARMHPSLPRSPSLFLHNSRDSSLQNYLIQSYITIITIFDPGANCLYNANVMELSRPAQKCISPKTINLEQSRVLVQSRMVLHLFGAWAMTALQLRSPCSAFCRGAMLPQTIFELYSQLLGKQY